MYSLYTPSPLLRPYIDSYWRVQSDDPTTVLHERIMVDGQADILFNLGAPYRRHDPTDATRDSTLARSNVDAQRRYPILIAQRGVIDLLGVRFRAGGLSAFLSAPLIEFTDLALDLDVAFGRSIHDVEGQLYDVRHDAPAQIALLDAFFTRQRRPIPSASLSAYELAHRIDQTRGGVKIAALSREIGYSIRTLDRQFMSAFGFTPKFYARIARFRAVLKQLETRPSDSIVAVAFDHAYTDQAHFSRDFMALAGQTPSEYRAAFSPSPQRVQFLQDEPA